MDILRGIFDDWLTKAALLVLVLAAATVIFNIFSHLPEEFPLFGVFTYSLVPMLFAAGGIIFVLAILRIVLRSNGNANE